MMGQRKNILGFAGHLVSVAAIQLCCFRMKIAIENKLVSVLCYNITGLQLVEYLLDLFYRLHFANFVLLITVKILAYVGDWNMLKFSGSEKCLGNFHWGDNLQRVNGGNFSGTGIYFFHLVFFLVIPAVWKNL